MAERVEDRGKPISGHEGLCRLTDRGTGLRRSLHDSVDIGAVQRGRMGGEARRVGSCQLVGVLRVGQLQPSAAEVEFSVLGGGGLEKRDSSTAPRRGGPRPAGVGVRPPSLGPVGGSQRIR